MFNVHIKYYNVESNLTRQIKYFTNTLNIFHMSGWGRVYRKQKGRPAKKNTGRWLDKIFCVSHSKQDHHQISSPPVEAVSKCVRPPIGSTSKNTLQKHGVRGLTGHVLVAGATQHGVHGVSHFVEEVLHHAGRKQGGGAPGGVGQAQHQHHHRQLVLAAVPAPAAAADGEVAVLRGGRRYADIFSHFSWSSY